MEFETNNDLLRQLYKLEWLLRRQHMRHHFRGGPMASVHRGQGRILSLLKLKPDMSQKELGGILDIRSQSLGELLGKLEKAGFISRTASEADRRVMEIHLTEAGQAAADAEPEADPLDALFEVLSADEQTAFAATLQKLIDHLEAQPGPVEGEFDPRHRGGFGFGPRDGFGPPDRGHGPFDRGHGPFDRGGHDRGGHHRGPRPE